MEDKKKKEALALEEKLLGELRRKVTPVDLLKVASKLVAYKEDVYITMITKRNPEPSDQEPDSIRFVLYSGVFPRDERNEIMYDKEGKSVTKSMTSEQTDCRVLLEVEDKRPKLNFRSARWLWEADCCTSTGQVASFIQNRYRLEDVEKGPQYLTKLYRVFYSKALE